MRREDLSRVHDYIGGIIKRLNASVIAIGGVENHVHILSSLPKTMALSDYVRTIKAESSRWIKGLDTCYRFFAWQEGYGAFSVSATKIDTVKNYIHNQDVHHRQVTFKEEYVQFLKAYDIQYDDRYLEND